MTLTRARFAMRTLAHHARSYALVTIVAMVASAIITGALFVGDSVRGSLRDRVEDRLGGVDYALTAPGFFREALGGELKTKGPTAPAGIARSVAILLVKGAVTHADSGARAGEVNVLGVPPDFWDFWGEPSRPDAPLREALKDRSILLNESLAAAVGAKAGSAILVHIAKESDVPAEHALGRKSGTVRPIRLDVGGVLPGRGPGLFDLESSQAPVRNVFVPIETLARSLGREGHANAILVSSALPLLQVQAGLQAAWRLEDAGLRLRLNQALGIVALESSALLLPSVAVKAAKEAAGAHGFGWSETLTYLANTIAVGDHEIPYSTVAATELVLDHAIGPGTIALSAWAAEDLGARVGDTVRLKYFVDGGDHQLREAEASFSLSEIVPLDRDAADPDWTPQYPGISDAKSLRAWDPPFPVDLDRIRTQDDDYWTSHKTTPKAFLPIADGKRLWASRFGDLTSLRFRPVDGNRENLEDRRTALGEALSRGIRPESLGLTFRPVKADGLRAAEEGTDFGGLFVGFSFFLIASAIALLSMVFRLACERRARELGVLKAVGATPGALTWLLLVDGAVGSTIGAAVGCLLALGYASLLLLGLRTIWKGAVNAPFLSMHTSPVSWGVGCGITLACTIGAVALVARRVARSSPGSLLSGRISDDGAGASSDSRRPRAGRPGRILAIAGALAGVGLVAGGQLRLLPAEAGFFGGGACFCVASLAAFRVWLGVARRRETARRPARSVLRLGALNARRSPARSMLTASLIASASFVIVAVAASRRDPGALEPEKGSGNGGFALVGKLAIPITESLSNASGREALGLSPQASRLLEKATVFQLRVRPGDDASCLNLYRPQAPRLLGAPRSFIERGGFEWAGSSALTPEEKANPWLLLERKLEDGALPAIGDASTVKWILHSGLGEDIWIAGDDGAQIRLRIVALVAHSLFQGELVLSENRLLEAFPRVSGSRLILVEAAREDTSAITAELERALEPHGLDVETTGALLAGYQAVENTYLSTFQLLGGLGLLLGTLGLAAVLLRNVNERRGELALLRAVGASRRTLLKLVLSETTLLLAAGLLCGAGSAAVAILPSSVERPGSVPWAGLGVTFVLIAAAGLIASLAAVRTAFRAPLIPALRRD